MQIQFIGCGKMWEAFLKWLLQAWITQSQINIYEIYEPRVNELKQLYPKIKFKINNNSEILILATKPQQLKKLDFSIFKQNTTILSMLAWSWVETIKNYSQLKNIVRCMPNLPLSIWQWAGGYYISWNPDNQQLELIQKLFKQLWYFIKIENEDDINKITAISWSGPAYFLYFTELLQQQAENMWFSVQEAKNLAEQTFIWTANLLRSNWLSAKEIKENVTSKWWTTEAALKYFQEKWLWNIIINATNKAYKKSKKLNS